MRRNLTGVAGVGLVLLVLAACQQPAREIAMGGKLTAAKATGATVLPRELAAWVQWDPSDQAQFAATYSCIGRLSQSVKIWFVTFDDSRGLAANIAAAAQLHAAFPEIEIVPFLQGGNYLVHGLGDPGRWQAAARAVRTVVQACGARRGGIDLEIAEWYVTTAPEGRRDPMPDLALVRQGVALFADELPEGIVYPSYYGPDHQLGVTITKACGGVGLKVVALGYQYQGALSSPGMKAFIAATETYAGGVANTIALLQCDQNNPRRPQAWPFGATTLQHVATSPELARVPTTVLFVAEGTPQAVAFSVGLGAAIAERDALRQAEALAAERARADGAERKISAVRAALAGE